MYTHSCDLYAQRLTCMRNLMFWNTLQDIELNNSRVLPKNYRRKSYKKSYKLITHLNGEFLATVWYSKQYLKRKIEKAHFKTYLIWGKVLYYDIITFGNDC